MSDFNSSDYSTAQLLQLVIVGMEINLIKIEQERYFYLEKGYVIEIEQHNLFKLTQNTQVIAPYDDMEEMLLFVKNH